MGWEMRRGKLVYYRKERYRDAEGRSRVRSIYCGLGESAEAAAREDLERRRARLVNALMELGSEAERLTFPVIHQVEPPRRAPVPMPSPSPVRSFAPARSEPRRLRGLAAWRAMGQSARLLRLSLTR